MDTHASPGKSPAEQWEKQRDEKKYIYYSILCRIFIGLLCHWSHALCWPRPALSTMWSLYIVLYWWPVVDLFFHVKCIFRNKCLCFKTAVQCVFSLHVACSFMIIMKEEVAESIHIYVLLVQKQGHYLYSPLRFHSWPLENPSWRVILYLAIIIIILWKAVGATLQVWLSAYH